MTHYAQAKPLILLKTFNTPNNSVDLRITVVASLSIGGTFSFYFMALTPVTQEVVPHMYN